MTAPGAGTPDGSYTPATVGGMQNMTETSIMAGLRGPVDAAAGGARISFLATLSAIATALFGPGAGAPLPRLEDGMTALNGRLDSLDDVPGYAGGIMTQNRRFGNGGVYKKIPFNAPYGPAKKAHLDTSSNRMVLETGSWSAHFTISTSGGGGVGHGLRALVRDKNGTEVMTRYFDWQTPNAGWDQHYAMPIIVPPESAPWSIELGYRHSGLWWTLYGGTEKTLIWVERKNIDTANSTIIRNPTDGPDIP